MQLRYLSIPMLAAEAGGDPWAIDASLQAGRPAQISDLARAFRDGGRSTTEASAAFDEARRRFEASWNRRNGDHPINDSAEVLRVTTALGVQAAQLSRIAVDLESIAAALAEAQHIFARYIWALEDDLDDIDSEIGDALADDDQDLADELRVDAVAETGAILFQLNRIRDGYAAWLQTALRGLRAAGADAAEIRAVDELLIPPPDTDAQRVKDWWDSLSDEQNSLLVEQHPQELGNLNGIPADVRDSVNQAVLNDDLRRVEDVASRRGLAPETVRGDALQGQGNEVFANPGSYGLSTTDIARYQNAVQTSQGLDHDRGVDSDHPRPVMLWAYDPLAFNGKGRAAIAIGDPDKSANTAVIVPGTNSSVKEGWLSDGHNDAINLYDQSLRANPARSTAVLAWMGYAAPEFDYQHWEPAVIDPAELQGVGTPWSARQGGVLLAADVNGLAVTHHGATHATVLGHSYGATTMADAFANNGMRADDAVLVGCPGTDLADGAADFHLSAGKVYVGAASTDAVSWIGESGVGMSGVFDDALGEPLGPLVGLGADPARDGFGAVRFRAEVAGSQSIMPWFGDHSHYYDVGSEALRNMTDIVTGHGDNLVGEGMTAPYRTDARISIPSKVHTPVGTLPLPHVEIRIPVVVDPEWQRPGNSVTNDHGFR
jgi:Alpha/beta hydrolase